MIYLFMNNVKHNVKFDAQMFQVIYEQTSIKEELKRIQYIHQDVKSLQPIIQRGETENKGLFSS